MSTLNCKNCGSLISEDTKFCENCGAAVVTAPSPSQPAPTPSWPQPASQPVPANPASMRVKGTGPSNQKLFIGLGAAIVLVLIGFGAWKMLSKPGTGAKVSQQDESARQSPVSPPKTTVTVAQDGEAFLGRWFPSDSTGSESNNIITFSRQGSKIVGVSNQDPGSRIELAAAAGNQLSGEAVDSKGERTPVTAEILSDGQKMVLTLSPPASEPDIVVLWKVKEGEAPSRKGIGEGGFGTQQEIDEDKAAEIVSQLPEVDKYCKALDSAGKRAKFDTTEEDPQTWMVHVYEIVDDGDGLSHTATFGWFKVDKRTGKVSNGME